MPVTVMLVLPFLGPYVGDIVAMALEHDDCDVVGCDCDIVTKHVYIIASKMMNNSNCIDTARCQTKLTPFMVLIMFTMNLITPFPLTPPLPPYILCLSLPKSNN